MSDIFTHLAERALGSAATIQPLLMPRFAAASDLVEPEEALAASANPSLAVSPLQPTPPHSHESAERQPAAASYSTQETLLSTHATFAPQTPPPPATLPQPPAAWPQADISNSLQTSPRPETTQAHPIVATRKELAAQASTLIPMDRDEQTAQPFVPPTPQPAPVRAAQATPTLPLARPASLRPDAPLPAARTSTLPTAASLENEIAPQAPPTIHVSIGRIEVRAVAPAQTAASTPARPIASRSSSVMTLDEYLKRAGGSQ